MNETPKEALIAESLFENLSKLTLVSAAANIHFCRLVSHPHGINEPPLDYESLATEAVELAEKTTPYLLKALGLESITE